MRRHLGLLGRSASQLSTCTWGPGMLGKPRGHQGWGLHSPDKWRGKQRSHGGPGTHQQCRCCRGGKNESSELSSRVRFTEAPGVGGGACGSHPVLRDSKALPEEPPGQALIQWFPNACDHEPFLGRTSVSSRGSGTQSGKSAPLLRLEESGRGTWSVVLLPVCGGSGERGQPRPRFPLPGGVGGEVETASQLGRQGCCSWKVVLLGPSIDRLICWLIDLLVFIDSLPPFMFPVPPVCQASALWDLKGWKARPAGQGPLVSEVLEPVTCPGENQQVWPGEGSLSRDNAWVEPSRALKGTRRRSQHRPRARLGRQGLLGE